MFDYSVDELVQKAYKNEEFMKVFNGLELPITLLGQTYRGYLIKEYLDSPVSELDMELGLANVDIKS